MMNKKKKIKMAHPSLGDKEGDEEYIYGRKWDSV